MVSGDVLRVGFRVVSSYIGIGFWLSVDFLLVCFVCLGGRNKMLSLFFEIWGFVKFSFMSSFVFVVWVVGNSEVGNKIFIVFKAVLKVGCFGFGRIWKRLVCLG